MVIDNLSPEAQIWLKTEAERAHVDPEAIIRRLVELAAGKETTLSSDNEEWQRVGLTPIIPIPSLMVDMETRLRLLQETPPAPHDRQSLPDDALRREMIYADDDR